MALLHLQSDHASISMQLGRAHRDRDAARRETAEVRAELRQELEAARAAAAAEAAEMRALLDASRDSAPSATALAPASAAAPAATAAFPAAAAGALRIDIGDAPALGAPRRRRRSWLRPLWWAFRIFTSHGRGWGLAGGKLRLVPGSPRHGSSARHELKVV